MQWKNLKTMYMYEKTYKSVIIDKFITAGSSLQIIYCANCVWK
jgi:hypothetical protein